MIHNDTNISILMTAISVSNTEDKLTDYSSIIKLVHISL